MSKIVGIDLGTTNSLVATVDSGIPLVIADAGVLAAIDLDDQPCFDAGKIDNIWSDRKLAPEAPA